MESPHLESLLRELHSELEAGRSLDPDRRKLVDQLAREIEAILASDPPARQSRYEGLRASLTDAATAFEAAHPRLGTAVENVIDALVRLNL